MRRARRVRRKLDYCDDHKHVDAGDDCLLSSGAEAPIELSDSVECLKLAALRKDEVWKLFDKSRSRTVNT